METSKRPEGREPEGAVPAAWQGLGPQPSQHQRHHLALRPAAPRGQRLAAAGLSEGKRECAQKKEELLGLGQAEATPSAAAPAARPGDIYGHVAGDGQKAHCLLHRPFQPRERPPRAGLGSAPGTRMVNPGASSEQRLQDFIFICRRRSHRALSGHPPAPTVTTSLLVLQRPDCPRHTARRPEIRHSPATALPRSLESHICFRFQPVGP